MSQHTIAIIAFVVSVIAVLLSLSPLIKFGNFFDELAYKEKHPTYKLKRDLRNTTSPHSKSRKKKSDN